MASPATRARLPPVAFERGLCFRSISNGADGLHPRPRRSYDVIGRVDGDMPFRLSYESLGLTGWDSPQRLGEPLRRKILDLLRQEVRYAESLPPYMVPHDFLESPDPRAEIAPIRAAFLRTWQRDYLGDREEDDVWLDVPFAEKDDAKALGATFDGARRKWKAKRRDDMTAFERWLPREETASPSP